MNQQPIAGLHPHFVQRLDNLLKRDFSQDGSRISRAA
jgi:hypothetical protein